MSSEGVVAGEAIVVAGVSKCYPLYARPEDRLKQALLPRLSRLVGRAPRAYFKECWAVREVSLTVARGETVGIVGRNGSGKSTLLQMICGTLAPTAGEIRVSGRVAALLELGSGFNPEFSGRENVYLNGAILGMSREEVDAKFDRIVAFAELAEVIDQPVKTYSSGMYVRLAFAVIAHADADLLVVDEALSVGDVFFAQKCMRFLREFQRTGTVLFVSHDAGAVTSLCDRAVWLDGGRVVLDGPSKEVCEAYHASTYGVAPVGRSAAPVRAADAPSPDAPPAAPADAAELGESSRMRVFAFDPDAAGFGDGRAEITAVRLEDDAGRPLVHVVGGERVQLVVEAVAYADVASAVVGFILKDRLGQLLFTRTTWPDDDARVTVAAGSRLRAVFAFEMPYLRRGRYTLDVAVADGTPLQHVQMSWRYDALAIECTDTTVLAGIFGLPFRAISLHTLPAES